MFMKHIRILRRMIQKKYKIFDTRSIAKRINQKCYFQEKRGKYFIIQITKKPRAALVRFLSERTCILVQPVIISNYIKWQISSRFFMNNIRDEKLLSKLSVIMSEKFALKNIFQQVLEGIQAVESKKVNMMYTCDVCNWKFSEQNYFDEHMLTHSELLIISQEEELEDGQYEILSEVNEELPIQTKEHPNNEIVESLVMKPNLQEENQVEHVCDDCDKNFTKKEFLDYHVQIQHKKFTCKYCPIVYKGEHAFKSHLKIHAEEFSNRTKEILKGIDLNQKDFNHSNLRSSKSKSNDLSTKCSYCPYKCDKKTDLDEHISLFHSNTMNFKRFDSNLSEVFSCSICNLNFTKRFHLDRHMPVHTHHIYQCSKCQGSFQLKQSFLNHLENVHSKSYDNEFYKHFKLNLHLALAFRCGFCRFAAKKRCRVDEHTFAEHYEEYSSKDEGTIKKNDDHTLEELPRKRLSSGQFKKPEPNSISTLNSTFKFKCRFCGSAFLTVATRFRHELEYHSSKGNMKKKSSQSNMKQLIDDLTSEVSTTFIACTKCPQIFTVKSMYENHLSSHHLSKT